MIFSLLPFPEYVSIYIIFITKLVLAKSNNLYCEYCDHQKPNQEDCGSKNDELTLNNKQKVVKVTSASSTKDLEKLEISITKMNGFYRPRSAMARALYEKHINDMRLEDTDKEEWYRVDSSRLSPELQSKFVQLGPDEETQEFLSSSIDKSSWVWTQIWYLLAKNVLKHFWTNTDINGWLGRGSMFVLSEAQAKQLLPTPDPADGPSSMVDVGAGDGEVAKKFAPLFQERYATEISGSMRKALANKGFTILDTEEWWQQGRFSCICMLNLIDRCRKPRSMLMDARAALAPSGVLLVALVLPYKPYVEVTPDHKPEERLPIEGVGFEQQAASFITFMQSLGLELVRWSRVPYLSEGDFTQAYYWLDDSIYVFRSTASSSSAR